MSKLQHVNEIDFSEVVLKSTKPVLVDFWAEWCGPCRALGPVLEEISSETADEINIVKLNVDEAGNLARQYNIKGIPTMLFFKNGQVVSTLVGNQPRSEILDSIKNLK